ncbi:MAG: MMPL family transporter, partial [Clostridiales bacterium]|nr:MMPL family transporter [Clostridiales bacterium]
MQSERLAKFIVKHNKAFLVALVVLLIISASLFYFALKNINYDITKYLPKGYYTDKCYEILNKYFSVTSDFEVAFTATEEQAKSIVDKIRSNSDVAFLLWYEDLALLKKLNVMTDEEFLQYETLFKKNNGGESFDYALIVSIKHSPSSLETLKVLKELKNIFFDSVGKNVSFSGLSELAYQLYVSLAYEIIFYIAAGVGIGILFLLIFTPSFIEPLIILLPVLFSIVINLGSHIIKPGLSIVAFIGSAILQLAVTLDFSSSFLICFKKFKKGSKTIQEALSCAVKLFFKSALPACLILMISALSLCAMKFTIGFDLGIAFAKGIVISFLTVLLSLPAVILMFNGAKIKTSHKNPTIEFSYLIKTAIKQRKIIACIFAVIFIISVFFGAVYINKTYLNISTENTDFSERQVMADTLSNQLILALPCNENLIDTHYLFNERLNMLKNAGEISFVLSVFSAIPKEATINVSDIIPINIPPLPAPTALSLVVAFINDLGDSLQPEGSGSDAVKIIDVAKKLISNGYTLYTVGLNCDSVESEKAFIILDKINSIASEVFYQNTDNIDFIYKKGINIAG